MTLLSLILTAALGLGSPAPALHPVAAIDAAAREHGVDPVLLSAIALRESRLEPHALNVRGRSYFPADAAAALEVLAEHVEAIEAGRVDVGLCQINSRWAARFAGASEAGFDVTDLLDPAVNATAAALLLRYEIDQAGGDVWVGVARYHTGPVTDRNRERGERYAAGVRSTYEALITSLAREDLDR